MENKKGFTLIEIIAAVIILGIISIVAAVTYTSSMREFRDSYYTSLEKTLVESGKSFFDDNRSYRPTTIFTAQKVPISILESKSYVDDILDYNGNKCDRSSYVIAIKAAKNDYIYHACLACSEDTYSNLEDKYCDSSWDDPTTVKPDLVTMDAAYVYKNTSQEKLREKLKTAVSITKYDRNGEIIASVSGDGVDGIPEILPENIDIVDTSKVGVYTVTYKYNNKSVDRRVHIYENSEPEVIIYKTNVYADKVQETVVTEKTETTTYSSGQWAQEINFKFEPGSVFYAESGERISQYQWNKGGQWTKICDVIDSNGSCTLDYRQEMNEEVAFRVVDTEGNISKVTVPVIIRVDRTAPVCTLTVTEGTLGLNDWYHSNIKIGFEVLKDQTSTISEAKSGIEFNSIRRGATVYTQSPRTSSLEALHEDESQYIWYYGFVEDKAQNYAKCSIKVRKDTVKPICSITEHSTIKCTDATSKLIKAYFGKDASAEGDSVNFLSEWPTTGVGTSPAVVDSTGVWYLKATDHSGYTTTVSANYYLVSYDKNGGNTGPTKASEIKRETELADLTPTARKVGWKMIGWHTSKTSQVALDSHTVTNHVTLYAVYKQCNTGEYTDAVGTSCVPCPAGYKDGAPVGSKAECQKKVTAGHYLETANDENQKDCANGYWKGEHWLKYGETSTCNICPAGYRDGTTTANKTAENKCLKNITAGHYLETANDENQKECANGYYKTAHSLTYGQTSTCSQCKPGYRDGTDVTNKVAENKCLKNVAAGYHVETANDENASECGKGTYKGAHTVTYGSKSSCSACPDGYKDGTALANKTAQNKCLKNVSKGYYVKKANDATATICSAGYYKAAHSLTYGEVSTCSQCPSGFTSAAGSEKKQNCYKNATPTKYTKTTRTCGIKGYNYAFYNSAQLNGVTGITHCGSDSFTCNATNYGKSYDTCVTNYNYYFDPEQSNNNASGCNSFDTCNASNYGKTSVSCNTTYSWGTGSSSTVASCTASTPSCNASSHSSKKVTCTQIQYGPYYGQYTKTEYPCNSSTTKKTKYCNRRISSYDVTTHKCGRTVSGYEFKDSSEANLTSCSTTSSFTCNSDNNGSSYVSACTVTEYTCSSDSTLSGSLCYSK